MNTSISTGIFRRDDTPPEEAAGILADAGFNQVELARACDRVPEYNKTLNDLGISVWAVHGTLWMDAIAPDPAIRAQALQKEYDLMEKNAVYAPCPYVAHWLDRSKDPEPGKLFREAIAGLEAKAAELGFVIAVETMPFKPKQYDRYADTNELAAFVRSFNSKHVGICMDVNHANNNEDLNQGILNCGDLIVTVHISDNHGIIEEHLLPGEGIIDFGAMADALKEAGYTGPCNLEVRPPDEMTPAAFKTLREWGDSALKLS